MTAALNFNVFERERERERERETYWRAIKHQRAAVQEMASFSADVARFYVFAVDIKILFYILSREIY